jgi:hypothetical protein
LSILVAACAQRSVSEPLHSYKFALAKALYDLKAAPDELVRLDELAAPFSRHLCEHLKHSPKQITAKSSRFLTVCQQHNEGQLSEEELISSTVRLGFNNVIDAFHVVAQGEVPRRFFLDERKTSGGIRLTEHFFALAQSPQFLSMAHETEARWRLVEEGWRLGLSRNLLAIEYDPALKQLVSGGKQRRVSIASCRDSLNGYQKGRCFYCYQTISVDVGDNDLADVDHFLPWRLHQDIPAIDGAWNLVLACKECNRGESGKFHRVPALALLERLHEYFIGSHLPLRETLIQQTGTSEAARISFLQAQYNIAKTLLIHDWRPPVRGVEVL